MSLFTNNPVRMKNIIVNQNDPRVLKTKSQFMKAFKELLLVYDDYMNITVKELCVTANLNRKTFYLHYKQVDDLFSQLQEEAIRDFNEIIKDVDVYKDVEGVIMAYFDFNESNPVYQKLTLSPYYTYTKEISRRKALPVFKEKNKLTEDIHNKDYIRDYVISFYYYTGYFAYLKWVRSNRPIPKEEAVKIAASLIKNGISSTQNL